MITLITPTGKRPEAFKLCEHWVGRALSKLSRHQVQWIVVDDYPAEPTKCTLGQTYLEGPLKWDPTVNTQRYNLEKALEVVQGEYIFIVEDDDYYSEEYFSEYLEVLKNNQAVGLARACYYHMLIPGYREMENHSHSSLSQTAFRKDILPVFREAVHSGQYYIDVKFWELIQARRIPNALLSHSNLSIGIKGLPGRIGLGIGHSRKDFFEDRDLVKLKDWLGKDHSRYMNFLSNQGLGEAGVHLPKPQSLRDLYRSGKPLVINK